MRKTWNEPHFQRLNIGMITYAYLGMAAHFLHLGIMRPEAALWTVRGDPMVTPRLFWLPSACPAPASDEGLLVLSLHPCGSTARRCTCCCALMHAGGA